MPELNIHTVKESLEETKREVIQRFVGNTDVVDTAIISRAVGRHILLEGRPGSGKSEFAKCLADADGLSLARVNGHPETLPSDFIGYIIDSIKDDGQTKEEFRSGAVFNSTLFVDELNRVSARTLNALLQAKGERRVNFVINGEAVEFRLSAALGVVATQNPLASHVGTTRLDPATLDRFGVHLTMGGYSNEELSRIEHLQIEKTRDEIRAELERGTPIGVIKRELFTPDTRLTPTERTFLERYLWITNNVTTDPRMDVVRWEFARGIADNDKLITPPEVPKNTLCAPAETRLSIDLMHLTMGRAAMRGSLIADIDDLQYFIDAATTHRVGLNTAGDYISFSDNDSTEQNIKDIIHNVYQSAERAAGVKCNRG